MGRRRKLPPTPVLKQPIRPDAPCREKTNVVCPNMGECLRCEADQGEICKCPEPKC